MNRLASSVLAAAAMATFAPTPAWGKTLILAVGDRGSVLTGNRFTSSRVECSGVSQLAEFLQGRLEPVRFDVPPQPRTVDAQGYALPDFDSRLETEVDQYRATIQDLEREAGLRLRSALAASDITAVIVFGHGHGATLVLRVLNALAQNGTFAERLKIVRLVTVDLISRGYPSAGTASTAPAGVPTLNIYQLDGAEPGGRVRGAAELDVSGRAMQENQIWREVDPEYQPCQVCVRPEDCELPDASLQAVDASQRFPYGGLHAYLQFSRLVRRAALEWLETTWPSGRLGGPVDFMEGVWRLEAKGVIRSYPFRALTYERPITPTSQWFVLYQSDSRYLPPSSYMVFVRKRRGETPTRMFAYRPNGGDLMISGATGGGKIFGDVMFFASHEPDGTRPCVTDFAGSMTKNSEILVHAEGYQKFGCVLPGPPDSIFDGVITGQVLSASTPLVGGVTERPNLMVTGIEYVQGPFSDGGTPVVVAGRPGVFFVEVKAQRFDVVPEMPVAVEVRVEGQGTWRGSFSRRDFDAQFEAQREVWTTVVRLATDQPFAPFGNAALPSAPMKVVAIVNPDATLEESTREDNQLTRDYLVVNTPKTKILFLRMACPSCGGPVENPEASIAEHRAAAGVLPFFGIELQYDPEPVATSSSAGDEGVYLDEKTLNEKRMAFWPAACTTVGVVPANYFTLRYPNDTGAISFMGVTNLMMMASLVRLENRMTTAHELMHRFGLIGHDDSVFSVGPMPPSYSLLPRPTSGYSLGEDICYGSPRWCGRANAPPRPSLRSVTPVPGTPAYGVTYADWLHLAVSLRTANECR